MGPAGIEPTTKRTWVLFLFGNIFVIVVTLLLACAQRWRNLPVNFIRNLTGKALTVSSLAGAIVTITNLWLS